MDFQSPYQTPAPSALSFTVQGAARPRGGRPVPLGPLVLQSFEDPSHLPEAPGWARRGLPLRQTTALLTLSYWTWSSTLVQGSQKRRYDALSLLLATAKLLVSWPLLFLLVCAGDEFDKRKPTSSYDIPLCKSPDAVDPSLGVSANAARSSRAVTTDEDDGLPPDQTYSDILPLSDDLPPAPTSETNTSAREGRIDRSNWMSGASLLPRFLCFVVDADRGLYETRRVSDYIREQGSQADTEFIFVSYTRLQFRVATEEEIDNYDYPDEQTREANREIAKRDRQMLAKWGIEAAVAAGIKAFWLDFECVRDSDGVARSTSTSEDVYRICDVVRAAHSMIIAIGPPVSTRIASLASGESETGQPAACNDPESVTTWLRQWGSRLWTLPELLLCPNEYRIKLYVFGNSGEPRALAKRNFAERAWDDAVAVKELVNHFEGSAILTQLQLIESALECFSRRKTDQFSQGDIAYAIMGLLPEQQRPKINHADSGFIAFARLLLANDSGRFLERLLCVLPSGGAAAPWYDTNDCWGAKLRDIYPACQVTGIEDPDTVLLDGALGAVIEWDRLDPVAIQPLRSLRGRIDEMVSRLTVGFAFLCKMSMWVQAPMAAICLIASRRGARADAATIGGFLVMLVTAALTALPTLAVPTMLLHSRSKVKSMDARFIGIEGSVDPGTVERFLLGFNHGIFTEIPTLQQYLDDEDGSSTPRGREGQDKAKSDGHLFTLVDTVTMTIARFRARRPPVAVFICAQDGGMYRSLLCSYDQHTGIFHRETVLRLSTPVLVKMNRAGTFRLSFSRPPLDDIATNSQQPRQSHSDVEQESVSSFGAAAPPPITNPPPSKDAVDRTTTWKMDWALIPSLLVIFADDSHFGGHWYSRQVDRMPTQVAYFAAFLVMQIPVFFLLRRLYMQRILLLAILLKGLVHSALEMPNFPGYRASLGTVMAIAGATDGILTPAFVLLALSWYPITQAAPRLLVCALAGRAILNAATYALGPAFSVFLPTFWITVYFAWVSCGGIAGLGFPGSVRWLPTRDQTKLSRYAALRHPASPGGHCAGSLSWASYYKSPFHPKVVRAVLILGISIANSASTITVISNEVLPITVAIVIAVVLSRWVKATIPALLVCTLLQLRDVVKPLVWVLIVSYSTSWTEGSVGLFISLAGHAAGELLHTQFAPNGYKALAILFPILQGSFMLLFWGYSYWLVVRQRSGGGIVLV